ncbi:MAG: glycosyltransferase [Pseudodesulfovibrio sp.]|nr:glycosyltransferase [Pseudodesulfovibrio sp.]
MNTSQKILLLTPSLEVGGAERQLVSLAGCLQGRGHDVHVALFRRQGALLEDLPEEVWTHDLEKQGRLDFFGFMLRLRKLVQNVRPDVIYSFLGVPNLATVLLKMSGVHVPIVWSVRASDVDLSHYGWLPRACCAVEALLSRFADHIVVNSNAGREHSIGQGFSHKVMSVVFNGIDTNRFKPNSASGALLREQWRPDRTGILVGIVARLDPLKDHPTFLRAAKLALHQNPDLCFVCIGDGPLGDQLKELADQFGLSENLVWAGVHSDMPAVYNALDFLCLSSITEGFPNVLGEAMSCGVPCVTTDVGDAAYEVGGTGLVVPKSNPEAMAEAILAMAERVRNGEIPDTRARIEEYFSLERMVRDTEKILFEVLL